MQNTLPIRVLLLIYFFYGAGITILFNHQKKTDLAVYHHCKVCRLLLIPIVVFIDWIEVWEEIVKMECEKSHVGTHCIAEAYLHRKIVFVIDIIVYAAEHNVLTADFQSTFSKADVIVGFLSCSTIETSIEKDCILFNRVGKMIAFQ